MRFTVSMILDGLGITCGDTGMATTACDHLPPSGQFQLSWRLKGSEYRNYAISCYQFKWESCLMV